jgi:hypothetical protein
MSLFDLDRRAMQHAFLSLIGCVKCISSVIYVSSTDCLTVLKMINSYKQTPCLVSAYLSGQCHHDRKFLLI